MLSLINDLRSKRELVRRLCSRATAQGICLRNIVQPRGCCTGCVPRCREQWEGRGQSRRLPAARGRRIDLADKVTVGRVLDKETGVAGADERPLNEEFARHYYGRFTGGRPSPRCMRLCRKCHPRYPTIDEGYETRVGFLGRKRNSTTGGSSRGRVPSGWLKRRSEHQLLHMVQEFGIH